MVGGIFFIEAERLGLLKLRAKFLLPAELKIQSARCRHWDQTLQLGAASSETQDTAGDSGGSKLDTTKSVDHMKPGQYDHFEY